MTSNVPMLPGLTPREVGKTSYHKTQNLVFSNDVRTLSDRASSAGSKTPTKVGGTPAWLAFDKQVLQFYAYFLESVHERREEQFRVRNVRILFYLEDDTIQVYEDFQENSGIPQGTLIRRHRIPKPAPHDDQFYNVDDLNLSIEVTMYGRTFKIIDCDAFTRSFLTKLGVTVNPPSLPPQDTYQKQRDDLKETMQAKRPYEKPKHALKQFIEHDKEVLRFYGLWDDSEAEYGDKRKMVLHYFLADDTIEIKEVFPANCGRDHTPSFLRRQKLPKAVQPAKLPGQMTQRTVLNVFGPWGTGGRHILDSLRTGASDGPEYTDRDLHIGATINLYGRPLLLCDCDDFTKSYYSSKFGITEFPAISMDQETFQAPPREIPPYNGIGSEEDTLANCTQLIPKPAKKIPHQFVSRDRTMLESFVLRFIARMDSSHPIDADRRFIISFFVEDGTLSVFEQAVRNSGIPGGKFLERMKVKRADGQGYIAYEDIYVGGRLVVLSHKFVVLEADEYAYRFMEEHQHPHSRVGEIFAILKDAVSAQQDAFASQLKSVSDAQGNVSATKFRASLARFVPEGTLSEQQVQTLIRALSRAPVSNVDVDTLVYQFQKTLAVENSDRFKDARSAFLHYDKDRTGELTAVQVRQICLDYNIPTTPQLIDAIFERFPKNSEGKIDFVMFAQFLDYKSNPIQAVKGSVTKEETLPKNLQATISLTEAPSGSNQINSEMFLDVLFQQ